MHTAVLAKSVHDHVPAIDIANMHIVELATLNDIVTGYV